MSDDNVKEFIADSGFDARGAKFHSDLLELCRKTTGMPYTTMIGCLEVVKIDLMHQCGVFEDDNRD